MVAALKSLSDNFNIYAILMLALVDCLVIHIEIFLVLGVTSDFDYILDILGIMLWDSGFYLILF